MLKLSCYQFLTLDTTYSLSLIFCFSPTLPSCVFLFMYALHFCFLLHTLLRPTLALPALHIHNYAMFSDLIYKTLLHEIIQHVQISTFILISLSAWPHSEPLYPWTSVSKLPELILIESRSTLALFVTSTLTSLEYAQFWINFQTPRLLLKLLVCTWNTWTWVVGT